MFEPVITIDLDWAPDYMIEPMTQLLIESGVRATWLITHTSPSVEYLRDYPELFELGIHPNFHTASTQGTTPEEVIDHCMALVPTARCVRTHGLLQSTRLLYDLSRRAELQIDLSLFYRCHSNARPVNFEYRDAKLLRLPDIWKDDAEMGRPDAIWGLDPILEFNGLKILGFHPVHVFLNCQTGQSYDEIKRRGPVDVCPESDSRKLVRTGVGPATMFREVIDYLVKRGRGEKISDLAEKGEAKFG